MELLDILIPSLRYANFLLLSLVYILPGMYMLSGRWLRLWFLGCNSRGRSLSWSLSGCPLGCNWLAGRYLAILSARCLCLCCCLAAWFLRCRFCSCSRTFLVLLRSFSRTLLALFRGSSLGCLLGGCSLGSRLDIRFSLGCTLSYLLGESSAVVGALLGVIPEKNDGKLQ